MAEPNRQNPIRDTDDEALALARELARETLGAVGVLDPATGYPAVSRATVIVAEGEPVLLVSDLSHHTKAMTADPRVSVLLGTAPTKDGRLKGDPLAFPRVTVFGRAAKVERRSEDHASLREAWLAAHPKAALYIDFGDFAFWRVGVERASLNGGFGKAYELTAEEWQRAVA